MTPTGATGVRGSGIVLTSARPLSPVPGALAPTVVGPVVILTADAETVGILTRPPTEDAKLLLRPKKLLQPWLRFAFPGRRPSKLLQTELRPIT